MPSLILLRGLPGAGKSTLANIMSEGGKYPVFSIDDYFTNPNTGEYNFDFSKNHLAYKTCEENTIAALRNNIEKVFVANTFTIDWELEPYFKMAKEFNYMLFITTVENYHDNNNTHAIPDEHIEKMASKYKIKLY